jgi:glycosyltransferase involved in cell wall biosynthesis
MPTLVSVCIPIFNGEKTILRAIDSLINQTYPNLEIVISDNSSTDNTLNLIRSIKDERLLILERDRNYGLHNNFLYAVENATGEYVMTMGADDELYMESIEELVRCITSDDSNAAFGKTLRISNDDQREIIFNVYQKEGNLINAICSKEKLNFLICGLWKREVYYSSMKIQCQKLALLGTSSDRLFVFFALYNFGIKYHLSEQFVYKKYYLDRSSKSISFVKPAFYSILHCLYLIKQNKNKLTLYTHFFPCWLLFNVRNVFEQLTYKFWTWLKKNLQPDTIENLRVIIKKTLLSK